MGGQQTLTPNERALTEQLDEANETIRQLRAENSVPLRHYSGFSKSEAAIVSLLSDGRIHTAGRIRQALDAINQRIDAGSNVSAQLMICRTRTKLRLKAPLAFIVTVERAGYSMTAGSIAVMDRLLLA